MKYFIVIYCNLKERKIEKSPEVKEIIGIYSEKALFEKMQELHLKEILYCVYSAYHELDFS
jgi:hypothetical protein